MNDSRERPFSVSDRQRTYRVDATQRHRAHPRGARPMLEGQFSIEELHLTLDGDDVVSIDDDSRILRVVGKGTTAMVDEIRTCGVDQRATGVAETT